MAKRHEQKNDGESFVSTPEVESTATGIRRRTFLQQGAAIGVGALGLQTVSTRADANLGSPTNVPAREKSSVKLYKPLGKTGLNISDISLGSGALKDRTVLRKALDRGINYFDTADGYPLGAFGAAEKNIGLELGSRRNDIVIATKSQVKPDARRMGIMKRLNASLARMKTDHVDIYFNHAVNELARLQNDEWFEFVELAKKQGKIRFSGMSGHGGNLIECLDYAIDNDLVDVILAAHNFGQDPAFYQKFLKGFDLVAVQVDLPRVFAKAHAKGIGTIAMKTLMGAKLNDLRPFERDGGTYSQAAFRWVLSNPDVDALIVSMNSEDKLDEYLAASGTAKVTANDVELLKRYAVTNGLSYCRHGCNACEASCNDGVPIAELLRTRMYATDYADLEMARGSYADLGDAASPCLSCVDQTCLGACPIGINIPSRTKTLPGLLHG